MYVNSTWRCTPKDRLSQRALLALIFDEQANETQVIEIADYNGLPDGGSFTLRVSGQITQPIYYSQNYVATLARLNLALATITPVEVSSIGATRFMVEFQNATNVPQMTLVENNLTLDGSPAGRIVITTKRQGGRSGSPYTMLKKLDLSQWSIISFNAKTRIACVVIQNPNPIYLSINVPFEDAI